MFFLLLSTLKQKQNWEKKQIGYMFDWSRKLLSKFFTSLKYLLSGTFLFPKKCLFMIHMSNIHSLLSRKTSCFSNFFFFIRSRSTCPNQRWQMLFIAMLVNVTGVLVARILRTRIAASFADHFRRFTTTEIKQTTRVNLFKGVLTRQNFKNSHSNY